jgi:hypothetical protein
LHPSRFGFTISNMDPTAQPAPVVIPTSPNNFGPQRPAGNNLLLWVLIGVLGVGAVAFGIMSVVAFGEANKAKTTVEQQKKVAVDAARSDQKKQDQQAAEIASESPFRSYVAPLEFGSFEIKFPKNWSGYAQQSLTNGTQVDLAIHPDFVRRDDGTDRLMATRIQLLKRTMNDYLKTFEAQKALTRTDVTISGVKGVQITGKFQDKRTTRLVVVPIRDKSLIFINEDVTYAHEFDQILAQSKVLP